MERAIGEPFIFFLISYYAQSLISSVNLMQYWIMLPYRVKVKSKKR